MSVKKLSVKKSPDGKLSIFKKGSEKAEDNNPEEKQPPWEDDATNHPTDISGGQVVGTLQESKVEDGVVVSSNEQSEVLAEVKATKPMANVGFAIARTVNLGDYESVKVTVSIHVPSEVSEDEIEGNYEFAKGWSEMKLNEYLEENGLIE